MPQHPQRSHRRPSSSLWTNAQALLLAIFFAALAILFRPLLSAWTERRAARVRGGWTRDVYLEGRVLGNSVNQQEYVYCDVVRVEAGALSGRDFEKLYRGERPLVLTSSGAPALVFNRRRWPFVKGGVEVWEKERLLERYGEELMVGVKDFVYEDLVVSRSHTHAHEGGGGAEEGGILPFDVPRKVALRDFVRRHLDPVFSEEEEDEEEEGEEGISRGEEDAIAIAAAAAAGGGGINKASWTLKELPQALRDTLQTPTHFKSWYHSEEEEREHVRVSLGKSRGGKAWHTSESDRWSALLYGGHVLWFFYPPGEGLTGAGGMKKGTGHPLLGPFEWYAGVLPVLHYHDGGEEEEEEGEEEKGGGKEEGGEEQEPRLWDLPPLSCVQRPGDVVVIPSRWKIMALNIGQVVSVEGEAPPFPSSPPAVTRAGAAAGAREDNRREEQLQSHVRLLREKRHRADFESLIAAGKGYAYKALNLVKTPVSREAFLNQSFTYFRSAAMVRPCDVRGHLLAAEALLAVQNYERAKTILRTAEQQYLSLDSGVCLFPSWVGEERRKVLVAGFRVKVSLFYVRAGDGVEAERSLRDTIRMLLKRRVGGGGGGGVEMIIVAYKMLVYVLLLNGKREEAVGASERAIWEMSSRGGGRGGGRREIVEETRKAFHRILS